uniref:Uncharacterized protein n=1 Tax=Cacopsylla melanoneura TaxID=428564 RepID=A0A8D8W3W4_9HEMI
MVVADVMGKSKKTKTNLKSLKQKKMLPSDSEDDGDIDDEMTGSSFLDMEAEEDNEFDQDENSEDDDFLNDEESGSDDSNFLDDEAKEDNRLESEEDDDDEEEEEGGEDEEEEEEENEEEKGLAKIKNENLFIMMYNIEDLGQSIVILIIFKRVNCLLHFHTITGQTITNGLIEMDTPYND